MKKTIVFVVALFSLIQCTNNNGNRADAEAENERNDSLVLTSPKNPFSFIEVPKQVFTITNTRDTVILGKKGTKIFIPKNCFDVTGNKAVELTLKEYYSYSDFLAENLTTTSNGKQLESNGMINLAAQCDNKEVKLKKKKSITVGFPKNKSKNDFKLFYGTKDTADKINWQADFTRAEGSKKNGLVKLSYAGPERKGFRVATYGPTTEKPIENLDLLNFADEKNGDVTDYLVNKFTFNDRDAVPFPADESVNLYFTLSKQGKLVYQSADFDYNEPLKKKLVDFFKQMPNLKPYINEAGVAEELPVYYTIQPNKSLSDFLEADPGNLKILKDIREQKEQKEREETAREKRKEDSVRRMVEEQVKKIEKADSMFADFNTYSISKLGWINCDRFNNEPGERIEFALENINIDFNARMIFKGIKSMLESHVDNDGKTVFSRIPKDKEVRIVAMRFENFEPYVAMAEVNTNAKSCKLDFKKCTKAEALKLFDDL